MLDVDDRLESDLRSFLDAIKAEPLPRQLAEFRPATVRSKNRLLHRFVGAVGIAVVAAAVVLFAIELTGHPNNGSPIPGGQSAATPTPEPTPPSPASSVAPAHSPGTPPYLDEGPAPPGARVLIPVTYGTGPMTLPRFTASPTDNISIELGCLSTSAAVSTVTVNEYDPGFVGDTLVGQCFGGSGGSGGGGTNGLGKTVTMKIQAAPTEKWVILVYVDTGEGP
ncbi:MAG TPA: hypothetical protein VI434_02420 [Candidatus Dormibacteraeota bacterium]